MASRKLDDPVLLAHARKNRKSSTLSEQMLWRGLRNRRLCGLKFRRQYIIDPFIVDFYCVECKLVVEIDGSAHEGRESYDRQRQDYLEMTGLRVIRFPSDRVLSDLTTTLREIAIACGIEEPVV